MMRRVLAEFAPARRLPKAVWWTVGAAALLAAGFAWHAGDELQRAEHELRRAQEAIREARERLLSDSEAAASIAQAQQTFDASAKAWEAERRMPLADALRLLERVQMDGLVVRSLDMSTQTGVFRLGVEAPSHEAVVRFGKALNDGVVVQPSGALRWRLVQSDARAGGGAVQAWFEGATR